MENTAILVLAAGLGKRMGSELPKVLASTRQGPIIEMVLSACNQILASQIVVVTGHKRELVELAIKSGGASNKYDLNKITFAYQSPERKGTGEAARAGLSLINDGVDSVLIVCGDTPLIRPETLVRFLHEHQQTKADLSLITFSTKSPNSYGRVVRRNGKILKIVEERDCSPAEKNIDELNSAIYAVKLGLLKEALANLKNHNAQGEYYLTDIVDFAAKSGRSISGVKFGDDSEFQGVNTRWDLTLVNGVINMRKILELVNAGVVVEDPNSIYIDSTVDVAPGVKIGPNVQLRGSTQIGSNVVIEGNALLIDCTIGQEAIIKFGVRAESAKIGRGTSVGPFANLRAGTVLGNEVKIGNFVETKNVSLADRAKASHLTYLGDCAVGHDTNIGAGTITCNYDGQKKHKTTIGANVFIGSNTALVAPITIEDGATVGAGSVITKTVKKDSLALTRASLITKEGWATKRAKS